MLTLFSDMNDTVRMMNAFERQLHRAFASESRHFDPSALAMRDAGDDIVLTADLPGYAPGDVDISIEHEVLTLKAEKKAETLEGYQMVRSERSRARVLRQVELPCRVDGERVQAKLEDGVLVITLPKAAEAKPRKIAVTSSTPPQGTA